MRLTLLLLISLIFLFQNCEQTNLADSQREHLAVTSRSEAGQSFELAHSEEPQSYPGEISIKVESDFTVSLLDTKGAFKALYGNLEPDARYLVPVRNKRVANYKGELVQRYIKTSHPNYSTRQLSSKTKIDPRMACGEDLVGDGTHSRAKYSHDFSDIAPRALIANTNGKKSFLLFGGHTNPFNMVGSSLRLLKRDCSSPVYKSAVKPLYTDHRSFEWISNVYTRNGKTIYAFANNDWRACTELSNIQGCKDPAVGYSMNENNWWWASFTSLVSTNSGKSFRSPKQEPVNYVIAKPSNEELQRIVGPSMYFNPKGITGFYQSTNLMRSPIDGNYYFITRRQEKSMLLADGSVQNGKKGFCVLRAAHGSVLSAPSSWKSASSLSPQADFQGNAALGECEIFNPELFNKDGEQVTLSELRHVSYNTYLGKFIALGTGRVQRSSGVTASALVIVTTADSSLTSWDQRATEVLDTRYCSSGDCPSTLADLADGTRVYEIKYPNLIDPQYEQLVASQGFKDLVATHQGSQRVTSDISERRNFDVTGQRPWLYFSYKDGKAKAGAISMDSLEIVRIPIELNK